MVIPRPASRASCLRPATRPCSLPEDVADYPEGVARVLRALLLAGVNGSYALVLGTTGFTAATGGAEDGYPVSSNWKLVDAPVTWSQALQGGAMVLRSQPSLRDIL